MCSRRKIPLDIFENKTTYDSSYVAHKQQRPKIYKGPFEPKTIGRSKKKKPFILKSYDTLRPWRCALPFDALWESKPITRTHPMQTFDPNFKLENTVSDEVLKNRRRVYMLPQISMDDIQDPQVRKHFVDDMYTSDWKKLSGEINLLCTKRKIANSVLENPSSLQMRYEYDMVNTYPLDWLQKCQEWDKNYPDHVINQTELFWQTYNSKNKV